MIAADTSALSAFLKGETGRDVALIQQALEAGTLCFPPVVITEILSDPKASNALGHALPEVELIEIREGYWHRAGKTRQTLKSRGMKAKIADALVAQSCIDHDVALITRDGDFRHFAKYCGLKLA